MAQRALVFWLSLACPAAGMMIAMPAVVQVGFQVGEIAHVLVGVAPGYDHHGEFSEPLEVSALLGLSAEMLRTDGRRIFLEVAFTHGLIDAQHDTGWEPRHYKTVRAGLNVRR